MIQYNNILAAIGQTPLIRLNRLAANVASPIYVKAEMLNPGVSVKDRIGLAMSVGIEKADDFEADQRNELARRRDIKRRTG